MLKTGNFRPIVGISLFFGYSRNVIVRDQSNTSTNIPITRINVVSAAGEASKIDKVVFTPAKAEELAAHAGPSNVSTVIIDEVEGDEPNEIAVEVPAASLSLLAKHAYKLNVQSDYATVSLSAETLQGMQSNNLDLFFHLVPLKNPALQAEIKAQIPVEYDGKNVKILGQSLEIETNYSGYDTDVYVPFHKNGIVPDTASLNLLRVYVLHSDGEKVMQEGTVVYDDKNIV